MYMSAETFKSLAFELCNQAAELGVSVQLFIEPTDITSNDSFEFNQSACENLIGEHDFIGKTITVSFDENVLYRDVLHVLAHEVRHAIHVSQGLYADYYDPEYTMQTQLLKAGVEFTQEHIIRPCNRTAYLAEVDCNRWAGKWLKSHGVKPRESNSYPYKRTASYLNNLFLTEMGYE